MFHRHERRRAEPSPDTVSPSVFHLNPESTLEHAADPHAYAAMVVEAMLTNGQPCNLAHMPRRLGRGVTRISSPALVQRDLSVEQTGVEVQEVSWSEFAALDADTMADGNSC